MSVSISDSTQSANGSGVDSDRWDEDSGVYPNEHQIRGKASSTLLGARYADEGSRTTPSSAGTGRLRNEDSSSTLKSYYDRQKSPLAISQQTSASSARDMALRKGMPPVIPRSPLMQVETFVDEFDRQFSKNIKDFEENESQVEDMKDKKKPAKLDLSRLFARSSSRPGDSPDLGRSPSSSHSNKEPERWNLRRVLSRESMRSSKSARPVESPDLLIEKKQSQISMNQLYDHYEQMPFRSPYMMDQIPESRVPSETGQPAKQNGNISHRVTREAQSPSSGKEGFSWKNVQKNAEPPWESTSATSHSSNHTKTSKHTNHSALSQSDLKKQSVLSLSSDSGDDSGEDLMRTPPPPPKKKMQNNKALRVLNGGSADSVTTRDSMSSMDRPVEVPKKSVRKDSHRRERDPARRREGEGRVKKERKGAMKETPFLTIPEISASSARISGPWPSPASESPSFTTSPPNFSKPRRPSLRTPGSSLRSPSIGSGRSSQQPTPPISPTSIEFRQYSDRSSRFMAVSREEEALLEALRQKRARMKEKIILEHESAKSASPPRRREVSRHASVSTFHTAPSIAPSSGTGKQTILLYLDTPMPGMPTHRPIEHTEPSPVMSEFMNFDSDLEDSTPRTSWAYRTMSGLPPDMPVSLLSPPTSAPRISAVGAQNGFVDEKAPKKSKKRSSNIQFLNEGRMVEEGEGDSVWGM